METQSKGLYIFLATVLAILLILNLLLCIIMPYLLIFEFIVAICEYFTIKKIKKINIQKEEYNERESLLLKKGYKKICNNLFLDEENKIINIMGNDYKFSQIIDCELIENSNSINSSYGKTKGKMKSNGKIKARTNTISTTSDFCNELYLSITTDNLNNPNVKLDIRGKGMLNVNSQKYKDVIKKANEIVSLFKLIISKNSQKYIENGTVTKIEHRYIEEKSNEQRLEELAKLHKDGVLTDYEYSIKKQELLNKIH